MNGSKNIFTRLGIVLIIWLVFMGSFINAAAQKPIRVAIAGLSHGHVGWVFNRKDKKDIDVVGIYETNPELVKLFIEKYKLNKALFFDNLETLLERVKPQAVSAFGPINEHVTVVRSCAPRKIDVMVEKPLATTFADAKEIQDLALKYSINVLTNFETSWYASNQYLYELLQKGKLGEIRRVLVSDGHQGPKEIGVSKEFLQILSDPKKNGAGALSDFGCYGANLMTWLLQGTRPMSVTAITHQNKPDIYPHVDDEATIVLQYPKAQCIIQASWNWTFSRKDLEVYGTKGYGIATGGTEVRQRFSQKDPEEQVRFDSRPSPFNDPFSMLYEVVSGRRRLGTYDQYGLAVNVLVVEILEAAERSAQTKQTVLL
ncbi:MAG: hypothetical protein NVS1B13_21720 [Flavisolibacter sp.]